MDLQNGYLFFELGLTALGLLYLLWYRLIARRLEAQRIRRIQERELPREALTRRRLIREFLLWNLDSFALAAALCGFMAYVLSRAGGSRLSLHGWGPLLFLAVILLLALIPVARKLRRILRGDFRLRRLMISGYKTQRGPKGGEQYVFYLGTTPGDFSYTAPAKLPDGKWFYVVLLGSDAVLVLRAERWTIDYALRRFMPTEEAWSREVSGE